MRNLHYSILNFSYSIIFENITRPPHMLKCSNQAKIFYNFSNKISLDFTQEIAKYSTQ